MKSIWSRRDRALHPKGEEAKDIDADEASAADDDDASAANKPVMEDVNVTDQLDERNKLLAPDPIRVKAWVAMPQTEWVFQPGELCPHRACAWRAARRWLENEFQRADRKCGGRGHLPAMNRPAIFSPGRARSRQGMVLFEVVMALFVFTLVAFSLVMALDSGFDAAMDRNEIDAVMCGLENQTALLHSARVLPGETDAPDDGSGIHYHIKVEQEQMLDQKKQFVPNMLSRATISATWKSTQANRRADVSGDNLPAMNARFSRSRATKNSKNGFKVAGAGLAPGRHSARDGYQPTASRSSR